MPQIQQLPAHIADLIAAGEVVERPASVCKELLENALDAGASAVSVELEHGGMTYLRVTDNGCGIAPEQLPTAFLRHATSKLRRAEDLAAIGTLGFRGEALAAIAAVSRLDIFSRARGADSGASLHLEGGVPGEVTAAGGPGGTTVCVRDLFYNTPARMKFMKKDSAEGAAAAAVVTQLALSHPEVSFKLLRDGQEVLHTPGDGKPLSAVYAALGRDFALALVEVHGRDGQLTVDGFVTKPLAGRGTRGMQTFFVNGRFIKSQLLTAAVEEAYANRLMKGKFPGCVLNVTLPADMVDVNVHPAKTVVKFLNEKQIFDLVYHAASDALDRDGAPEPLHTSPKPTAQAPKPQEFYRSMTAQEWRAQNEVKRPEPPKKDAPFIAVTSASSELGGRVSVSDFVRRTPAPPAKKPEAYRPAPKKREPAEQRQSHKAAVLLTVLIICAAVLAVLLLRSLGVFGTPTTAEATPTPTVSVATPAPTETPTPTPTPKPEPTYEVVTADVSWADAEAAAEAKGGHLVVIDSAEKWTRVAQLADESGLTYVWIGLHRVDSKLAWVRDNVDPVYNWASGEPSVHDTNGAAEDYVLITRTADGWYYNDCIGDPAGRYPQFYSGKIGYIIEIDP